MEQDDKPLLFDVDKSRFRPPEEEEKQTTAVHDGSNERTNFLCSQEYQTGCRENVDYLQCHTQVVKMERVYDTCYRPSIM